MATDLEAERQFIREHMKRVHAERGCPDVAKDPPYDPDDRGVPPEMFDGPVDDEGWVAWKLLPSTVTDADLSSLEERFGVQFPSLFKAYYSSFHHMFDQFNNGRRFIMLPDSPSDNPLGPLVEVIEAWKPLLQIGYLPFGAYEDGWGPLCFDLDAKDSDGDFPIVWIDHELLPAPDAGNFTKATMSKLAKPVYSSFRELFRDQFVDAPTPLRGLDPSS